MLAGQVMEGFSVSLTVTVKLHDFVLPQASVATQLTLLAPFGNAEPDAGAHVTFGLGSQLSVAVALNVTRAEHWPGSVLTALLAGQLMVGAVVSCTMIVWLWLL